MVMRTVDLRSDTVTRPTEAMRAAMAAADVDDEVLGSDPTAAQLEAEVARVMGKEAGLFVPSGTMGNLISVMVHCHVRGSEVILGDNSHIHVYENGGIFTIGGVHPWTVKNNPDGTMDLALIEAAIREPGGDLYLPTTKLICLENTQANCGGKCLSEEYTDKVGEIARRHGLKLHIDGARIFNTAVALEIPVDRLVKAADSVSVCLSKGLGAPVGSVIVGSNSFIAKHALHCADNVIKLKDDHRRAKNLADGLNQIKGLRVDTAGVETNMVFFHAVEGSNIKVEKLCKLLEQYGILVIPVGPSSIRIVLHHQISDGDVYYTLLCIEQGILKLQAEANSK